MRVGPQRGAAGGRLGRGHIQGGVAKVPCIKQAQEVPLHYHLPTAGVHQRPAPWQVRQHGGVE